MRQIEITVAVVVPTYRRPAELQKCLLALETQTYPPDEIIVVHHNTGDPETATMVAGWAAHLCGVPRKSVTVSVPGVIAAMEAGVKSTTCDVVVVVDDDVRLRQDWLDRCLRHYADSCVVGVGGRDVIPGQWSAWYDPRMPVGRVTWYGHVIGNHELGYGVARQVDVLKGANMSLRRQYWIFDHRLRGPGAQVHWELQVCLRARRRGGIFIYDPACLADHFPAERFDIEDRGAPQGQAIANSGHNEVYVLMTYLRWWQRITFISYAFLVGRRGSWAIVRWLLARVAGEKVTIAHHLMPSYRGKVSGLISWLFAVRSGAA